MITAKKYLLDIGLDEAHLPELFNDDDKSHYQITELMESYHQAKTKDLQEQVNRLRDGDNTLYYENSTRKGENTQLEKRVFRLEIIISRT